jgi:autotransporter-associated beta strand protein
LGVSGTGVKAADQFFAGDGSALTASKWGPSGGPYTNAFTAGNVANFSVVNSTASGAGGITVGGLVATENFTYSSPSGTLATGGMVASVTVAAGKTLDLSTLSISTAAGTGFIKNGDGAFATAGGTYAGGFTLNAGTIILRGVNAMGAAGALNLNGGIVAGSANRDLTGKYSSGINVGGDVQFGDVVGLASSSATLTFSNNMSLGAATRTLTLGNGGIVTFGGVISNTSAVGITFAATAGGTGRFDVTNTANTYTGTTTITGGEVRFSADLSLGTAPAAVTPDSLVIDGGRFSTLNNATFALNSNRGIQVGATAGTAISTTGTGTISYDGVIADKPATNGTWAKQGTGTLALGGISTYSGGTAINNGILQLTTGDDRLPAGTTVSLGQTATANHGTFDLNGRGQTIAGLNSTPGTNATTANNTVTSAAPAVLTLAGSGTYSYGDGTAANSGVIGGAIALAKTGAGTQTLGDDNTFSGSTSITGGMLVAAAVQPGQQALGGTSSINITTGTLLLGASNQIGASANVTVGSGGFFKTGGFSEGTAAAGQSAQAGMLSLNAGSTVDFAAGANGSSLLFSDFNYTPGSAVNIRGWSGAANLDDGTANNDRLLFLNDPGLSDAQLGAIQFFDDSQSPLGSGARQISFNGYTELVPLVVIPEPTTIFGALALVGVAGIRERRRFRTALSQLARQRRI